MAAAVDTTWNASISPNTRCSPAPLPLQPRGFPSASPSRYRLGISGAHGVDRRHSKRELSRTFAHSLIPIALAYAAAHYVSLLLFQGQALAPLASDPLGRGSDIFGTATWGIDYAFVTAEAFWYIQFAMVIGGHLAALALAHDRALAIYEDGRAATRSQMWMLAVMAGFTTLALWLLSEASKG